MAENEQNSAVQTNLEDEIKRLAAADEAEQAAADARAAVMAADAFDTVIRKEDDEPEGIAPETGKAEGGGAEDEALLSESNQKETKKSGGSSSILLFVLLGVLLLAIAAGVVMVVKMMQSMGAGTVVVETNHPPRSNIANNANFIYVPAPDAGTEGVVVLQKYIADRLGTVFYFKEALPEGCTLTMTDNLDRPYYCDTRRMEEKTVYFPPLSGDAQRFTLTVWDANGAVLSQFDLTEHTLNTPAVFLGTDAVSAESALQSTVRFAGAQLSSSGTTIWLFADTAMFSSALTLGNRVRLEENLGIVLKTADEPFVTPFEEDGVYLIRLDFAALKSLHSKLRLTVRDTAVYIPVNQTFALDALLTDGAAKNVAVDLGTHTLVLEGILKSKTGYTLVMHTEDTAITADPDNPAVNRTEGVPDVTLGLAQESGDIQIAGTVQSKKEGADVRFDLGEYADAFAAALESVYLQVDGLRVRQGDAVMHIDLSADAAEQEQNAALREAVELYYTAQNAIGKPGYVAYAEGAAALDGTVYAYVREGWLEDGAAVTQARRAMGTFSRGVYTLTADEVCE